MWTLIFYSNMLTCYDISLNSLKHLDTTLTIMWQMMWNGSGIFPFLVPGKSLVIQLIINLLSNISSLCISILAYYICSVKAVISSL